MARIPEAYFIYRLQVQMREGTVFRVPSNFEVWLWYQKVRESGRTDWVYA